jgi:transcription termination factor NusB
MVLKAGWIVKSIDGTLFDSGREVDFESQVQVMREAAVQVLMEAEATEEAALQRQAQPFSQTKQTPPCKRYKGCSARRDRMEKKRKESGQARLWEKQKCRV